MSIPRAFPRVDTVVTVVVIVDVIVDVVVVVIVTIGAVRRRHWHDERRRRRVEWRGCTMCGEGNLQRKCLMLYKKQFYFI